MTKLSYKTINIGYLFLYIYILQKLILILLQISISLFLILLNILIVSGDRIISESPYLDYCNSEMNREKNLEKKKIVLNFHLNIKS